MGLRFRRSVNLGGFKLNFGKSGVSTSIGVPGARMNFSNRGVYSSFGIPGSGISYRSKIYGEGGLTEQRSGKQTGKRIISATLSFDDETGEIAYKDENGQPLSDEWIKAAKKQNREYLDNHLEQCCSDFNQNVRKKIEIHLDTPSPDTRITYEPQPYNIPPPPSVIESDFQIEIPKLPETKQQNFLTRNIGFLSKKLEEENQRLIDEYNRKKKKQSELDKDLILAKEKYHSELDAWNLDKENFEQAELNKKRYVEVERYTDLMAMNDFLAEHLDAITWIYDTKVSFELSDDRKILWLDVDLPEIEMIPDKYAKLNHTTLNITIDKLSMKQRQLNYLAHIHAIGFRIIGESFVALPSITEIVFSGYSQRISNKTGKVEDEYLYSVRVDRNKWREIEFNNLQHIDVVACFEQFSLIRKISSAGVINPITPFEVN